MFISSFCSKSLIWDLVSFLSLLVPCVFFFISLCTAFAFSSICNHTQLFLWASWLAVFGILHLISWLYLHWLVLFWGFWSVLSFGLYFFVLVNVFHCKGRSLRYSLRRATHLAALWGWMWGRGVRGNSATCSLLAFSHIRCYPQANWALLVLIPWVGGWVVLCMFWNPMGFSNKLSCKVGSFPHHCKPHRFLQPEVLRRYFPVLETLGCATCIAPQ